jgi:hypothetical protein
MSDEFGNRPSRRINVLAKQITHILLVITVVAIGITAYFAYYGEFNKTTYYPTPQKIPFNSTNCSVSNEPFISFVLMNTTSLSSNNPIDVGVKLIPYNRMTDEQWSCFPQQQAMIFDNAFLYPPNFNSVGYPMPALVFLSKSNNPKQYYNETKIVYQSEGKHGYFYLTEEQVIETHTGIPISPNSLQNKELSYSEISVGSNSETTTAKTNNYVIMLTWVLIGFGILELRKLLTDLITWLIRLWIRFENYINTKRRR